MIGPLASEFVRRVAARLAQAGLVPSTADVDDVAEVLVAIVAEETCTCSELVTDPDPEWHDEGCAYLTLIEAVEGAAERRIAERSSRT